MMIFSFDFITMSVPSTRVIFRLVKAPARIRKIVTVLV